MESEITDFLNFIIVYKAFIVYQTCGSLFNLDNDCVLKFSRIKILMCQRMLKNQYVELRKLISII